LKEDLNKQLLSILRKGSIVATGCTEPISVAYAAAKAVELAEGSAIKKIEVKVDEGLFKNGVGAGIPGIEERGLKIAAALGAVIGNTQNELRLLENVTQDQLEKARSMVRANKIDVYINEIYKGFYLEVTVMTDDQQVRILILDHHQNVVSVEKGEHLEALKVESLRLENEPQAIQDYSLSDLIEFSKSVCISDIKFLEEGIKMAKVISEAGQKRKNGFGEAMVKMNADSMLNASLTEKVQMLAGSASEARMAGTSSPVMTSAGSGNHGITIFITNTVVAETLGCTQEKLIRAIVLSNLVTIYIKSYTGTLSAMCGCAVAAGVGAAAGVSYLLGGTEKEIFGAMVNMVGSIAGMLCDGAKEGCAFKVALASGWAVQSALLSLNAKHIALNDGVLGDNIRDLSMNLGSVCNIGMAEANGIINKLIQKNEER